MPMSAEPVPAMCRSGVSAAATAFGCTSIWPKMYERRARINDEIEAAVRSALS